MQDAKANCWKKWESCSKDQLLNWRNILKNRLVPLLVQMGLIFFTVTHTVLFSDFWPKITYFSCCLAVLTQHQGLSSCCSTSKQAEHAWEVGWGHSWDSWPQVTKGMFYSTWCHDDIMMSWSATKSWGKEDHLARWCLSFQVTTTHSCVELKGLSRLTHNSEALKDWS